MGKLWRQHTQKLCSFTEPWANPSLKCIWHCRTEANATVPPSSSQSRLLTAPRNGLCIWLRCVQHRCWQAVAAAGKNHPTRSFYLCFPNTPWTPTSPWECSLQDYSSQPKAESPYSVPTLSTSSPVAGEGDNNIPVDSETIAAFTFPWQNSWAQGEEPGHLLCSEGPQAHRVWIFARVPLKLNVWYWNIFKILTLSMIYKVTKGAYGQPGHCPVCCTLPRGRSSQATQCQGHYSFHWQAAGCLQLCNKLRGITPFLFYYQ